MLIYRPILKEAFTLINQRKALWFFGIFAGLINTGSLLEISARLFQNFQNTSTQTLKEIWLSTVPGLESTVAYWRTMAFLPTERGALMISLLTLIILLLLWAGLNSQAKIFADVKKRTKTSSWLYPSVPVFGRLLIFNVLTRLFLILISGLAGLLLFVLVPPNPAADILVSFSVFLLFVPASFLTGAFSILGLEQIVNQKKTVWQAFRETGRLIRRHPIAVLELSILLFLIALLATLGLTIVLLILTLPFRFFLWLALTSGSTVLWISTLSFNTIVSVGLIILFGGALTAFIYTAWSLFARQLNKKTLIISKLERLFFK